MHAGLYRTSFFYDLPKKGDERGKEADGFLKFGRKYQTSMFTPTTCQKLKISGISLLLQFIIVMPFAAFNQTTPQTVRGKNVILIIGDGMGFNAVKSAEYFSGRKMTWEEFPLKLAVTTFSADGIHSRDTGKFSPGYDPELAWKDPDYVRANTTESSAAATAMATGFKTHNKAIGMGPENDTLRNLVEIAKSLGKSAGVVSTVPFTHATPAGFVAHNRSRSKYPEIARDMILKSRCDVIIGTGNPAWDDNGRPLLKKWESSEYVGDSSFWAQIVSGSGDRTHFVFERKEYTVRDCSGDGKPDPWTVVQSLEDFRNLGHGSTPARVLGCPEVHTSLQIARSLEPGETKDSPPYVSPLIRTVPTLAEMALGALNVLDENPKGFFLMIEGGAIDWGEHSNLKGRTLEEVCGLDEAVKSVADWVSRNSSWEETIVIVTADHETGYLWGGPPFVPVADSGAGKLPLMKFNTTNHTNSLVPLYARGKGVELLKDVARGSDPVRGAYLDNTDIPKAIRRLWSLR
jgi:alkaline phosphatase